MPSTSKNLPNYVNNIVNSNLNDYDFPKHPNQQSRNYTNIANNDNSTESEDKKSEKF